MYDIWVSYVPLVFLTYKKAINMTLQKAIGNVMRAHRALKNLSQKFIADEMGLTPSGYGKIERGEEEDIKLKHLFSFAGLVGKKPSELLREAEEEVERLSELKSKFQTLSKRIRADK